MRMREEDMTTPGRDNASSSSQSFDDFDRKYGSRTHADSYTTKRERLQSEEEINKMGNRTALSLSLSLLERVHTCESQARGK